MNQKTQFCTFENSTKILNKIKNFQIKSKLEKTLRIFMIQFFDLNQKNKKLMEFFKAADIDHDG